MEAKAEEVKEPSLEPSLDKHVVRWVAINKGFRAGIDPRAEMMWSKSDVFAKIRDADFFYSELPCPEFPHSLKVTINAGVIRLIRRLPFIKDAQSQHEMLTSKLNEMRTEGQEIKDPESRFENWRACEKLERQISMNKAALLAFHDDRLAVLSLVKKYDKTRNKNVFLMEQLSDPNNFVGFPLCK